jgi:hypothetical protein
LKFERREKRRPEGAPTESHCRERSFASLRMTTAAVPIEIIGTQDDNRRERGRPRDASLQKALSRGEERGFEI